MFVVNITYNVAWGKGPEFEKLEKEKTELFKSFKGFVSKEEFRFLGNPFKYVVMVRWDTKEDAFVCGFDPRQDALAAEAYKKGMISGPNVVEYYERA